MGDLVRFVQPDYFLSDSESGSFTISGSASDLFLIAVQVISRIFFQILVAIEHLQLPDT